MIAIVGGGISGLALAWELESRGCECRVLEAGSRPGGVIRSGEVQGRVLDWGPQRTRLSAHMVRLIDALGLEPEVLTAPTDLPLLIYREGRLRRVPLKL
ncbi:MAG: FAD-dependent oxidoreductase, partial [Gemmatimonadales bacterium]